MAASFVPLLRFFAKNGKGGFTIPRFAIIILFVCTALFVGYSHRNVVSTTKHDVSHEYEWNDRSKESQYIAAYYYGYIVFQLVIGVLCQKWGGKWILAVGLGMSSLLTFIAPFVSANYTGLIMDRVFTGMFQGAALPATTALYAKWIPRAQYSIATGIQYSGMYLGTAFTNGIYNTILNAQKADGTTWGWRGNFWLFGLLGFIWLFFFCIFAASSPEEFAEIEDSKLIRHKPSKRSLADTTVRLGADKEQTQDDATPKDAAFISEGDIPILQRQNDPEAAQPIEFKHLIIHGQHYVLHAHPETPSVKFIAKLYLRMIYHPRSLVMFCCHFCSNWSMYLLMGYVPTYLSTILALDSSMRSIFGFLPYLLLYVVLLIASFSADYLSTRKVLSKTNVRKLMVTIGFIVPAACLIGLAFTSSTTVGSTLLVLAIAFSGCAIPGFFPLPLDLSPDYSGLIMSMSNTLATVAGIVAPLSTGNIVNNGGCSDTSADATNSSCRSSWQTVLFIASGVYIAGALIMVIFGSAEEVDWDGLVNRMFVPKEKAHAPVKVEESAEEA